MIVICWRSSHWPPHKLARSYRLESTATERRNGWLGFKRRYGREFKRQARHRLILAYAQDEVNCLLCFMTYIHTACTVNNHVVHTYSRNQNKCLDLFMLNLFPRGLCHGACGLYGVGNNITTTRTYYKSASRLQHPPPPHQQLALRKSLN